MQHDCCPYQKGNLYTHTSNSSRKMKAESGVRQRPWDARTCQQPPEARKRPGTHSPSQLQKEPPLFTDWQAPGYCLSAQLLSRVQLFATTWTAAHQAPQAMGFPRQEYWSGLSFPTARDLPDPGVESHLLCLLHTQADSLPLVPPGKPPVV